MAKKQHKWKYQINIKKKVLVLIILGVFLFVGLGYAILESNLNIFGTLEVSKYDNDKTLYGVIKKEMLKGGYAVKFEGAHQDSIDASKSVDDIYHFYADTGSKGQEVLNKNNVVFANQCWQMYRTTDTGGVRLLYNGKPEEIEIDGEVRLNCGNTRNYYQLGEIETTVSLNQAHYYAKNYTASTVDEVTTFTLIDDPDDPDDYKLITVNSSNAATTIPDIAENYPYVCKSTNTTSCTNNNFYKIISQNSGTSANAYQASYRDTIGYSAYNDNTNSLAYSGYMYGDVYPYTAINPLTEQSLRTHQNLFESASLGTTYWYANEIDWNITAANKYSLLNAYQVSSSEEYPNLVGEYTFRNASQTYTNATVRYITAVNGSTMYYKELKNGDTDIYLRVSDDIEDIGNGVYALKEPTTLVDLKTWYTNHADYRNKYTCGDSSTSCASPRFISDTTYYRYTYMSGNITIAKSVNGVELQDYVTIKPNEWFNGYNTTYADYVYTCGNTDTVCNPSNLKYIKSKSSTSYNYLPNHYYGKSIKYEDNKYKLVDYEGLEALDDLTVLLSHHYFCLTPGETECSEVAYIYYYSGNGYSLRYVLLNDPSIGGIDDAINAMLKKNTTDSSIKINLDKWYESHIKDTEYEAKIDDTIYCNNRNISQYGGWDANEGKVDQILKFEDYTPTSNIKCKNVEDSFSVSNDKAKLKYPIALMSASEMNILSYDTGRAIRGSASSSWYITPKQSSETNVYGTLGGTGGGYDTYTVSSKQGVRPAISLIKGTKYSSGDGSMTNPYVVDMSN